VVQIKANENDGLASQLGPAGYCFTALFVFGWLFESVADAQKWTWKQVSLGFRMQGVPSAQRSQHNTERVRFRAKREQLKGV